MKGAFDKAPNFGQQIEPLRTRIPYLTPTKYKSSIKHLNLLHQGLTLITNFKKAENITILLQGHQACTV